VKDVSGDEGTFLRLASVFVLYANQYYEKLSFSSSNGNCLYIKIDDGYDETMIPIDYKEYGQILDDELFETLICPMPEGGE
jgi:hypothetical protein